MSNQANPSGQAMRTLRQIAGLTLDNVAELADTAPAYLSKVERGVLTPTRGYVATVTSAITTYMLADATRRLTDKVPAA